MEPLGYAVLEGNESAAEDLFPADRFRLQVIGNDVVDVLQENDIRIKRIQVCKERPVPAGAEDQFPFVVPKRSVSRVHGQGVCRLFLRGDPDFKDRPGARFIISDYL